MSRRPPDVLLASTRWHSESPTTDLMQQIVHVNDCCVEFVKGIVTYKAWTANNLSSHNRSISYLYGPHYLLQVLGDDLDSPLKLHGHTKRKRNPNRRLRVLNPGSLPLGVVEVRHVATELPALPPTLSPNQREPVNSPDSPLDDETKFVLLVLIVLCVEGRCLSKLFPSEGSPDAQNQAMRIGGMEFPGKVIMGYQACSVVAFFWLPFSLSLCVCFIFQTEPKKKTRKYFGTGKCCQF
jgi:hypothetical protein